MLKAVAVARVGGEVAAVTGNLIIVEDDFGNPLVLVLRQSERDSIILTCTDADFNATLRALGLNKTVVASPLDMAPLPDGALRVPANQLAGFVT